MDRIACALIPRFELALRERSDPKLADKPAAVVDLAARPARVKSATSAAEAFGVQTGQIAQVAHALCPSLWVLPPDPPLIQRAEEEIFTALSTLSPLLDSDGHGAFFLGLQGMDRLIDSEDWYAREVCRTLSALGLSARVGIADRPFVAYVAATSAKQICVVPRGGGAALLSQVPLSQLGLSSKALELLTLLGMHHAQDLAELPNGALTDRLGKEGRALERLCRGEELFAHPTAAKVPVALPEAELDFESPREDLEALLFLGKSLVDRLLAQVAQRRSALVELTVVAHLFDRTRVRHPLTPSEATLDGRAVMELFRLYLSSAPYKSPVVRLSLRATRLGPASAKQLDLFHKQLQEEQAALAQAISRLVSAFGYPSVCSPLLKNTFHPEKRLAFAPFDPKAAQASRASEASEGSSSLPCAPMALRLFSPPQKVELSGKGRLRAGPAGRAQRILHAEGPQRLTGEWWEEAFDRSYYWLCLEDGSLCWVFQDGFEGGLYLQAMAD